MSSDEIIKVLKDAGWLFQIEWDGEQFEIVVCRPEWITNDIHQAVALPTGKGKSLAVAYDDLVVKIGVVGRGSGKNDSSI